MQQLSIFDIVPSGVDTPLLYPNPKKAASLAALAQRLQPQIDALKNPAIARLPLTRRRAQIIDGMDEEAKRLEKIQGWLLGMAEAAGRGDLPDILAGITTKVQLEIFLTFSQDTWNDDDIRRVFANPEGHYDLWIKRLHRANITTYAKAKRALAALHRLDKTPPQDTVQVQIRHLERQLLDRVLCDYFPTPAPIAKQMVNLAQLHPGQVVLEPSAGCGEIAQAIRAEGAIPHCVEVDALLRQILQLKGFEVVGDDFLQYWGLFDRIVTNPPFSQFMAHIRHAYLNCLKPGGRLIAIAPESVFFRRDKKMQQFREWLEEVGFEDEKLPDGSFMQGKNPTAVKTRLLIIDKR